MGAGAEKRQHHRFMARLDMRGEAFPFLLAGTVFRIVPWLVTALSPKLGEVAPRCRIQELTEEPAVGAVSLALAAARGDVRIPKYL